LAGYENIKDKGFDKRSAEELRVISSKGGKASGEARRRKADFKKTLNLLLTSEIDNPEWTPFLKSLGLDSTLESAVNTAMIREALSGNVKAYEAIAKYSAQSNDSEQVRKEKDIQIQKLQADLEKQQLEIERLRSEMSGGEETENDGFIEALKAEADEVWTDEE
jgi:hypothetical protein